MDFKVYKKEEVLQPEGREMVFVPGIIDLEPKLETKGTIQFLTGATLLEDGSKDLLEQECTLSTLWQKGLDPLDEEDGVRWSETLLEEVNPVQLMSDIVEAVAKVTPSVVVVFDTITDEKGNSYLTYKFKGAAL